MSSVKIIVLVAVFLVNFASSDYDFPGYANVCRRSQRDYSGCLTREINEHWSSWVRGIPSLGMPRIDPIEFDYLEDELSKGLLIGHVKARNVKVFGLSQQKHQLVTANWLGDRIEVEVKVTIPRLVLECDYQFKGAIRTFFDLPAGGRGHLKLTLTGLNTMYRLVGHVRNNKWVVEHFHTYPNAKGMRIYFDDLTFGNKVLNKALLFVVNEFWPFFFQRMKTTIDLLCDPPLTEFVNKYVFSQIPVSKLFPY